MQQLEGYTIHQQIYESNHSIIYRATRQRNQHPVILKKLKADYPTPSELTRYHQEYEIISNLDIPNVIKAYDLQAFDNSLVIVVEDFGGISLKKIINQQAFDIITSLQIIIQLAEGLGGIHAANIIHKDINPSNIVVNLEKNKVKIIDFGIATQLPQENPELKNPERLEGTLAYMSPEQTGRMNRSLDYRTDLYALGITSYELLTNHLPFNTIDALELVHCHIAKRPIAPHQINPQIPEVISHIIMKLMAKNAEARYQSAYGLQADLQACLEKLQATGSIENFYYGQQDFSGKFQIPQKLYGRQTEINTLLTAFERVAEGSKEMMLITGHAGIGKSVLVHEIYKPITKRQGYFINGKFDQLQNTPYSAIVAAFTQLVQQLLTESENRLLYWKQQLLEALGNNGQVIIDIIPEVELIIGEQPRLQQAGVTELQNRFNLIFENFIRVFCQPEHPLVIFLDDLQWADNASLKFIELMMTDKQTSYLFFIGAYRHQAVQPAHPLLLTLENLPKTLPIHSINLNPLDLSSIQELLADTLNHDTEELAPLAQLINQKTEGNPFFINEFLKTLYQEKIINFDFSTHQWQWQLSQIQTLDITDNVVELMIQKLKKLPNETQQLLRLAACIGNHFDLQQLTVIQQSTPQTLYQQLQPAIQEGLIIPISDWELATSHTTTSRLIIKRHKFLHDRVQQAAYALSSSEEVHKIHLQIARLILQNTPIEEKEENIFTIVNQYNLSQSLITDTTEKYQLAALNLIAGQKAKAATAYQAALEYLQHGLNLLPMDSWQTDYTLTFDLHLTCAQCEYLTGNLQASEKHFSALFTKTTTRLQKIQIYTEEIILYRSMGKHQRVFQLGVAALGLFDITVPEDLEVLKATIKKEREKQLIYLKDKTIAGLINLPTMADSEIYNLLNLLINVTPSSYYINPAYMGFMAFKMMNLSLQYGNSAVSAYGYTAAGVVTGGVYGDFKTAYELGKLGIALSEKFDIVSQKSKSYALMSLFINNWNQSIETDLTYSQQAYAYALEAGEFFYVGLSALIAVRARMVQGQSLTDVINEADKYIDFLQQKIHEIAPFLQISQQFAWALAGKTKTPLDFSTEDLPETTLLTTMQANQMKTPLHWYYITKAQLCYLLGEIDLALHFITESEKIIAVSANQIQTAEHYFYQALILIAHFPQANSAQQTEYRQQLDICQQKFTQWANHCPQNFAHKQALINAEIAYLEGDMLKAMDEYETAISLAKKYEFYQNLALSAELAGRFWLEREKSEIAQLYLRKAYYYYQLWGAKVKIQQLSEKYLKLIHKSALLTISPAMENSPGEDEFAVNSFNNLVTRQTDTTTTVGIEKNLDLVTVMKTSQAISSELKFEQLLKKFMQIVVENVGAEQGWLILQKNNNLFIEAQSLITQEEVLLFHGTPLSKAEEHPEDFSLPVSIVTYTARTRSPLVLNDASQSELFNRDPYIIQTQPKSVLCFPIIYKNQLSGILYLENNLAANSFTSERLIVLKLLASQIAISIENALFYKQLEKAQQTAEAASRAKTTFLANMSHELRTPLNAIIGYSDIIQEDAEDLGYIDILPDLDKINKAGQQLLGIISDILDISKIETEKVELHLSTFAVSDLVEEVVNMIQPLVDENENRLSVHFEEPLGDLYADYQKASQILLNLLNNAARFTRKGRIHLTASRQSLKQGEETKEWLNFRIADDGIGISPDKIDDIFMAFTQADNSPTREYDGAGLGLTISECFCCAMGGSIDVSSQEGVGSIFTVWLPTKVAN